MEGIRFHRSILGEVRRRRRAVGPGPGRRPLRASLLQRITALLFVSPALLCPALPTASASAGWTWQQNPPPPAFSSTLAADHPLAGRILDVRGARFVPASEMVRVLAQIDLVLLGEQHDNPDHHALQAWLVGRVAEGRRRPRLVFEMIDEEKQSTVVQHPLEVPADVDALGAALAWDKSGWPPFSTYRPIFEVALSRGLPIVGAGLSRAQVMTAGGPGGGPGAGEDPGLSVPLPDRLRRILADDIRDSHCGYATEAMIQSMSAVQRRRDLRLARALLAAPGRDGAVLIAGFGHVRRDYGVPLLLRALDPSRSSRSVGFLEVQQGADDAADYAQALGSAQLPFDYVWFTPRVNNDDPCETFRRQLEAMHKG